MVCVSKINDTAFFFNYFMLLYSFIFKRFLISVKYALKYIYFFVHFFHLFFKTFYIETIFIYDRALFFGIMVSEEHH